MDLLRHIFDLLRGEMGTVVSPSIVRLVMAAILGGLIGLERELKRKPAGLRTNMFICFGAAMFTILSDQLAEIHPGDHTRIAAQIIPGIGFIGAGSILHARGSVSGLTTAATLFVVASVGMAAGGGLYLTAIFATGVILIALYFLGRLEERFDLKSQVMTYEVHGRSPEEIFQELGAILDDERKAMHDVRLTISDGNCRVQFCVDASRSEHDSLMARLKQSSVIRGITSVGCTEHE
jgi:putative Mg2+ transporter-C (MgtC) family protein